MRIPIDKLKSKQVMFRLTQEEGSEITQTAEKEQRTHTTIIRRRYLLGKQIEEQQKNT